MAKSEPKLTSRTTTAAAMPIAVAEPSVGRCVSSIAAPPSSTCNRGERADSAVAITAFTSLVGSASPRSSKRTIAKPIARFREIWFGAAYGLTTPVTCGSRLIRASTRRTAARTERASTVPARA
jgi:hypothetical protein